ncbi:hypothetical protein [Verrucomicrobium spinosum]|uniref:hypothetical protein n=1 Tax=Verrucomicrobium spinosum TaxID=2736 RepID=UPI00094667DA|nr:hypothetical protein [Verrucomicrobium spinosum]
MAEEAAGLDEPSMLEYLLKELGVKVQRTYGLRTRELRNGICRVQFEGPWIGVGKAVAEGYKYTHYVAVRDGWVLCTVATPHHWVPEGVWRPAIGRFANTEPATGWHVTHWYEFEPLT